MKHEDGTAPCGLSPAKTVLVTHLHHTGHDSVLNNADSIPQTPGKGVHGRDVSNEQVLHVCGLPAHLGVKVQPPRLQAALFDDGLLHTRRRHTDLIFMVYANDDEPTFMTKVVFLMSMGNWSVSHPRSGDPVFASTEPSMPNLSGGVGDLL